MGDAIKKLLETVEPAHKRQRQDIDQQVRMHQWQQFGGLTHIVKTHIKGRTHHQHQGTQRRVGSHAVTQHIANGLVLVAAIMVAHNGRKAITEAHGKNNNKGKHHIDEAGGRQLLHTVMANHQCIGKS